MNTILNLTILSFIIVFIVDKSGVINSIKYFIGKHLGIKNVQIKPFECSLCLIFWTGLIYLTFFSTITLEYVLFVCLLSYLSNLINYIYDVIYCGIEIILYNIYTAFKNL